MTKAILFCHKIRKNVGFPKVVKNIFCRTEISKMRNIAATALLMISTFAKADIEVIQYDGPTECDFEESVQPGHYVRVHYNGTIDERSTEGERGKLFDSTYERNISSAFQSGKGQGINGKFECQRVPRRIWAVEMFFRCVVFVEYFRISFDNF